MILVDCRMSSNTLFPNPDPANERSLGTKCFGCNKNKDQCGKLNRCGGCQVISYCCKDCQKSDWEEHKLFCKIAKKCPEMFRGDYEGYAYRRFQVFEATKSVSDQKTRDSIELGLARDLLIQNFRDFCAGTCYSLEGQMALLEAVSIDSAHCKGDKSVAFMTVPNGPYILLAFSYALMTKHIELHILNIRPVRDFLRLLSQMLCHKDAALQFATLLELDVRGGPLNGSTSPSLLQLLIKFMTEFDGTADDVEGLAWLCFALVTIHIEDARIYSSIAEDVLNLVKIAGREEAIIPQLFNLAKIHARHTLTR